jgi:hypothetical protein
VTLDLTAIDALRWSHVSHVMIDNAYHGDFTEWGMVAYILTIPMPATSQATHALSATASMVGRVTLSSTFWTTDVLASIAKKAGAVMRQGISRQP